MSSSSRDREGSYWCYRCSRLIRVFNQESVFCPDCQGGFVEEVTNSPPPHPPFLSDGRRRRFPAAYMLDGSSPDPARITPFRRSRRTAGERSPFNPVIVLRNNNSNTSTNISNSDVVTVGDGDGSNRGGFELYYDDGGGSGLRPLPASMSEFLLGSGFDRLLDQLTQMEINGLGRYEHPPASKAAIESLPTIEINESHTNTESQSHCAVCKEEFELTCEAKEMPCNHLYHSDCILPWLALRNSCPVCRHELPVDSAASGDVGGGIEPEEEEPVGLTIWRLPGGGFAVGRFAGGRRNGSGGSGGGNGGVVDNRELPVVYTEMDGGFNNSGGGSNGSGVPRRIAWTARSTSGRSSGGLRRVMRSLFSCFGGQGSPPASSTETDRRSARNRGFLLLNSVSSRRRAAWHSEFVRRR